MYKKIKSRLSFSPSTDKMNPRKYGVDTVETGKGHEIKNS